MATTPSKGRRKKRRVRNLHPGRQVVKLTTQYNLGGRLYGQPWMETEVLVPDDVAMTLLEQEQRRVEAQRRYFEPRDALVQLNFDGPSRVRYVPAGRLDAEMADIRLGHAEPSVNLNPRDRFW